MTAQNSDDPMQTTAATQYDTSGNTAVTSSRNQVDGDEICPSGQATTKASVLEAQRPIDQWLNQYSLYHQNTLNKKIHFVCVPVIVFCILGLLWSIPVPAQVARWGAWFNVATAVVLLSTLYYTRLAPSLAIGMFVIASISIFILSHAEKWTGLKAWHWAVPLFLLAWIGQFIGHHIEGRRPAFANDLQFLLIGPLWILADLYRRVGIVY